LSFILDALRKSEHERQRQAGPGIADVPVARAPSRLPVALLAIAALLAVNLAVLVYFLLREEAPATPDEAPVTAAAPATAAPTATPAEVPSSPAPGTDAATAPSPAPVQAAVTPPAPVREVRPLAAEVTMQPAPRLRQEAPPPPDPSLLPPAPVSTPAPAAVTRQAATPVTRQDDYVPSLDTLPPQATAGLPQLNLDLHIYSPDPAQRAAFVNGRRYREGDTMPEGVEVLAITRDGVVLRHRGQRFLLPRQ
jgi:general secretion pathway protein B